jgi:hypothetical protein
MVEDHSRERSIARKPTDDSAIVSVEACSTLKRVSGPHNSHCMTLTGFAGPFLSWAGHPDSVVPLRQMDKAMASASQCPSTHRLGSTDSACPLPSLVC